MCIEKNSKKLPTNYCLSLDSSRIGLKNSQFFKEEVGFFLKKSSYDVFSECTYFIYESFGFS